MSENTVPFEYTLRPREDQPVYVPVVGEPYNPPPVATYLHIQVKLPFTVNREYGLAVDWQDDAGMRPSANKVQSLASDKTYNAGTLELTEDGTLWAHYIPENLETTYSVELTGPAAEYTIAALTKLFNHEYTVPTIQLEDESEEPGDAAYWDSNPDEGDNENEYED